LVSAKSSITILFTGVEPFGTSKLNPSGEVIKRISGGNIITAILPVAFAQSVEQLLQSIAQHNHDVAIY